MPTRLRINDLADFHALVKYYNYPSEMIIPRNLWEFVGSRMDLRIAAAEDEVGKFIWFEGTKVRPFPRQAKGAKVDLWDAEWVIGRDAEQTPKS